MNRRGFIEAALGSAVSPFCAPAQEASSRARTLNLKITGLKTFVVNAGSLNWVFCKVYTNGGLVGLGEGSVTSKEATVAQAIMEHERFLVGKDPTDIELLWQSMFRVPRWRGGPILNSAISAVEIALWDILGQALEVPIYKLLAEPRAAASGCTLTSGPLRTTACAPGSLATRPSRPRRFRPPTIW